MAAIGGIFGAFSTITKNFFEVNTISIDDWAFKLYYKYSTTLFIITSLTVTSKQFFGDPIECDAGHSSSMIDKDILEAYCWMYSTFTVPNDFKGQCAAEDLGPLNTNLLYNSYYQWVPMYLLAMAILFYLPRILWLSMEGGLMKFFSKGTRARIVDDYDKKQEELITYFQDHVRNKYNVYFFGFVACELLNLAVALAFFFLTDKFLNYRFLDYGVQVWAYYHLPPDEQMLPWVKNPLCRTFPRTVNCDYFRYGMGGEHESINAICILSLNIINDKVFYVLWWWIAFVVICSFLHLSHRIIQCMSGALRFQLINLRMYRYFKNSPKRTHVKEFLTKCSLGDWFILNQLSKNLYRPFFHDLVSSISYMEADDVKEDSDVGDNVFSMMLRPTYVSQESEAVN